MFSPYRVDVPVTDLDQDEDFFDDAHDSDLMDSFDYADAFTPSRFSRMKQFFRSKLRYNRLNQKRLASQPQTELRNFHIQRLNEKLNKTILSFAVFLVFILVIMFIGRGTIYKGALRFRSEKIILTNSTHHFHPTTIMISLDGFHPHYILPHRTPVLSDMLVNEYGPPYMTPSFPSSTFPNHWTLVTGLYPSEHGIVGNTFYDPKLHKQFINTNPKYGLNPDFWRGGEPLWTTAAKQGVNSAIHMWPGSEVPGVGDNGPLFVDDYNGTEPLSSKVGRIMDWLDIEDIAKRPQLILSYVPTIDQIGHKNGISGDLLVQGLKLVDAFVGAVKSELKKRNLQDIANLVVVSDHGMAPTSNDRVLILDDIVDLRKIEHVDGWPLFGLRPRKGYLEQEIFDEAKQNLAESLLGANYNLWKLEDFPEEFQFGGKLNDHKFNYRLAPIWLVPNVGYSIITKKDYAKSNNDYHPRGVHGYNNTELLMRAIFLGSGPYFESKLPKNKKVLPFANTDVYNILCDSLSIQPSANNGTQDGYSVSSSRMLPEKWSDPLSYPNVPFDVDHIVENATYDELWRESDNAAETEDNITASSIISKSSSSVTSEISSVSGSYASADGSTEENPKPDSGLMDKVMGDIGDLIGDIDDALEDTMEDVVDSVKGVLDSVKDAVDSVAHRNNE